MPKWHSIYPSCIWHVLPERHGLSFDSALLTKVYWNYASHILCVCVSSNFPINPNFTLPRKVFFKFISAAKLRLVHTKFFAITLLHVLIPCSKSCSLFSLLDFLHSSSILSLMKTVITKQLIHLIHLFLHFTLMIRTFFEYASFCSSFFMQLQVFFTTETSTKTIKKDRRILERPGRPPQRPQGLLKI